MGHNFKISERSEILKAPISLRSIILYYNVNVLIFLEELSWEIDKEAKIF